MSDTDARMAPAFNLAAKVDKVLFFGKRGKCTHDVEWIDLFHVWAERPDIVHAYVGFELSTGPCWQSGHNLSPDWDP